MYCVYTTYGKSCVVYCKLYLGSLRLEGQVHCMCFTPLYGKSCVVYCKLYFEIGGS